MITEQERIHCLDNGQALAGRGFSLLLTCCRRQLFMMVAGQSRPVKERRAFRNVKERRSLPGLRL